jgi:hypothetical protein
VALTTQQIEGLIAQLQTALGSGAITVEYDGRRVTYRSQQEIEAGIAYFQRLLAASGGAIAPESASRTSYAAFSRD